MTTIERIRKDPNLVLKPNPYLVDPEVPYLYQRRGALMLAARPRMILGDDVGLGKTLEQIVALTYLKTRDPGLKAVVFAEKASLHQWIEEIAWLAPGLRAEIISADLMPGEEAKRRAFRQFDADVLVTSSSLLYEYSTEMALGLAPRFVFVADEPAFRNHQTEVSKRSFELAGRAERVYGLTATLIEGKLKEAFGLYKVIAPGLFLTWDGFEKLYCETKPVRWKKKRCADGKTRMVPIPWPRKIVGYKNLRAFKDRISPHFYGRQQSNPEVEQALPEVIVRNVRVPLGTDQSRLVRDTMEGIVRSPAGISEIAQLAALTRCQQLVDMPSVLGEGEESAKMAVLEDLLRGTLYEKRVLVFSKLAKVAEEVASRLSRRKYKVGLMCGASTQRQREAVKASFQSPGGYQILVLTMAGGRALNLQRGGHLVELDGPWTYGQEHQLIGRVKRTGSEHRHVVVWKLLAELCDGRQTIDHHTWAFRAHGRALFEAVVGDSGADEVKKESDAQAAVWAGIRSRKRVEV